METIAERIIEVVNLNGGNRSALARRINVTPADISKLKNDPTRIPSDRTILDICNEFGINEEWLRYGTGVRESNASRKEEIETLLGATLKGSKELREAVTQAVLSRTEDELEVLEKMLWDIVYNLQKNKKGQDESQPK